MFEAAELGRTIAKEEYKARVPALRIELLEAQRQLTDARFPVIVVFQGVDGAGKGETVNLLNEWMDPRWIVTRAYGEPSDEESERPEYWRYWRDLPRKGRLGLFLSSWYSRPLLDRVYRRNGSADFDRQLDRIAGFERTLTDDGALILKFWMHLGKDAQKKHLQKPREGSAHALARDEAAVAALADVRQVRRRRRARAAAHEHRAGALDHRRRRRRSPSKSDGRDDDPRRRPQSAWRKAAASAWSGPRLHLRRTARPRLPAAENEPALLLRTRARRWTPRRRS